MSLFKSISKLISKTDPVANWARKQGGTIGTIGSIVNPGNQAAYKVAHGAPVNARTMMDPNGWVNPGVTQQQGQYTPYQPMFNQGGQGMSREQQLAQMLAGHQAQMSSMPTQAPGMAPQAPPPMAPPQGPPPMGASPFGQPNAQLGMSGPQQMQLGPAPMPAPRPQPMPMMGGAATNPQLYGAMLKRQM